LSAALKNMPRGRLCHTTTGRAQGSLQGSISIKYGGGSTHVGIWCRPCTLPLLGPRPLACIACGSLCTPSQQWGCKQWGPSPRSAS
jgi:hypothetical protein